MLSLKLLIAALGLCASIPEPPDKLPAAPAGKTFELVWQDEFNGTQLDTTRWECPNDMPRRDGWWMRSAVSLDGQGHLVMRTFREGDRLIDGCIRTRGRFEHAFGYYIARVRLQREPGHWPAFWLFNNSEGRLGDEGRDGSEIDIMEKPWRDGRLSQAVHWDGYGKAHKSASSKPSVDGLMEGWHTYSLLWTPEEYVFFVDAKETWRTRAGGVCQVPLYIKITDEIGKWAGDIKQAKLPDEFLVDYVRVYDLVPSDAQPSAQTQPSTQTQTSTQTQPREPRGLPPRMSPNSTSPVSPSGRTPSPPNFLVILCDDLGYGDLACFGHRTIRTPNLDRLAAQGMRLTDYYAPAPVCSPSRAGLLTGRNPNRFGVYDWIPDGSPMHMPRGETTIAAVLHEAGYATDQAGKWHCNGKFNSPDQPQPGDQGFDHWFATQNNALPNHANPINFVRDGKPVGPLQGYSCQIVADEAIDWLRHRRPADKPFFQYVCFHEPHEIVAAPQNLVDSYSAEANINRATYYACVTNMDAAVGRILAALDELKLADNTIVLFTSDNGPETLNRYPAAARSWGSPGPLRGMKLHIYDGGIRVPGIIRWPGHIAAGQVSHEPVGSVDLLPTFCALAGIRPPAGCKLDGTSIVPMFEGGPVNRPTPLFWLYCLALTKPKLAMRDGDWKLCAHWEVPGGAPVRGVDVSSLAETIKHARLTDFELYNIREDIGETHDLAAAKPQRVQRMSATLRELFKEIQSECPIWEK